MPSSFSPAQIGLASLTDSGRVRSENQDAFGEFTREDGARLMIVADGMGGHRGGATASRMCVEAMGRAFRGATTTDPQEMLRAGMITANEEIRDLAEREPSLAGMGTTAVALFFGTAGECLSAWVGDSRAYLLRDEELFALTEDHSLVAAWVRQGILTPEQAEIHPRKNELLRAVGVMPALEVDVREIELLPGDRFLLCSDGLCGVVPAATIALGLKGDPLEEVARRLVDSANDGGGPDNVTVQVIAVAAETAEAEPRASAAEDETEPEPAAEASAIQRAMPLLLAGLAMAAAGALLLWTMR